LDFLGFPRPKRVISIGYTRFPLEIFSSRFLSSGMTRQNGGPTIRHAKRDRVFMGQPYFIF
jgi:hypothetical protein